MDCLFSLKIYMLKSNTKGKVFGGGVFRRWCGHDSGGFLNEICAFVWDLSEIPGPFYHVKTQRERAIHELGSRLSHLTLGLLVPWSWTSSWELSKINFCSLSYSGYDSFFLWQPEWSSNYGKKCWNTNDIRHISFARKEHTQLTSEWISRNTSRAYLQERRDYCWALT